MEGVPAAVGSIFVLFSNGHLFQIETTHRLHYQNIPSAVSPWIIFRDWDLPP